MTDNFRHYIPKPIDKTTRRNSPFISPLPLRDSSICQVLQFLRPPHHHASTHLHRQAYRENQIARVKSHDRRNISNQNTYIENHIARGGHLAHLPIHAAVTTESAGSKSVSIHGPNGQNVSKPLARVHWPSDFCKSRAVTSLPIV